MPAPKDSSERERERSRLRYTTHLTHEHDSETLTASTRMVLDFEQGEVGNCLPNRSFKDSDVYGHRDGTFDQVSAAAWNKLQKTKQQKGWDQITLQSQRNME